MLHMKQCCDQYEHDEYWELTSVNKLLDAEDCSNSEIPYLSSCAYAAYHVANGIHYATYHVLQNEKAYTYYL